VLGDHRSRRHKRQFYHTPPCPRCHHHPGLRVAWGSQQGKSQLSRDLYSTCPLKQLPLCDKYVIRSPFRPLACLRVRGWHFQPRSGSRTEGRWRQWGSVPECVSHAAMLSPRRVASVPGRLKACAVSCQATASGQASSRDTRVPACGARPPVVGEFG
jgi:hypothetical protein